MEKKERLFWVILPLFLIFLSNTAFAQNISITAQSSYIRLNSYNGIISNNVYGVRITSRGEEVFLPNWNLTARVKGKINNTEGKSLDPSKLRIRINHISKDGPTPLQIGTDKKAIPLSEDEFSIIKNSNVPISTSVTNNVMQFYISFDIIVEGGDYLEELKSYNQYMLNMVFSIKDENNRLLSNSESSILMRITPQAE